MCDLFILSRSPLFLKLISETSLQKDIKSLFFATKSVSLLISIIETSPFSSRKRQSPSAAVLFILFEALAIPFFLKSSIDFSISPPVSSIAALQSLNPTPVISLSFFTLSIESLDIIILFYN